MERSKSPQSEKAVAFRKLHERNGAFVIPNPWDIGTAKLLAHLGFEALATTSAGYAFSAGSPIMKSSGARCCNTSPRSFPLRTCR